MKKFHLLLDEKPNEVILDTWRNRNNAVTLVSKHLKEIKMAAQYAEVGDVIDFTAGSWSNMGRAVIDSARTMRTGRREIKFKVIKGENAGKNFTCRLSSDDELFKHGKKVATDLKTASESLAARHKRENDRFSAAREASEWIEAGDLVQISSSKRSWRMKVLEVDFVKGRVKGVNAEAFYIAGKSSWASLTHPDVTITLIEKNAFNPKDDSDVKEQAARRAETTAKRNATRERRTMLRSIYGNF